MDPRDAIQRPPGTVTGEATGPPVTADLPVRVVTTPGEFDALEAVWNELLERSEATVFQSFEWLRAWWKYFGGSRRLRILVFGAEGSTEGIVPMFLSRERLLGIPVARRLQFIGVGLSDYLQPIASRGSERRVAEALASWLSAHQRDWDVLDLEDVPEAAASFAHLQAGITARKLPLVRYQGTVCPRIHLPETEAGLMRQLGPSSGYNLRRKVKRLQTVYRHRVRLIREPDAPLDRAMHDFSIIHGGRWKSQGHPSAFDDPHHVAFHVEVCRNLARRGWLRLYFLDVEDEPVAVCFGFNFRSTIYMYQSNAHADDEIMRCSPGLVIRSIAMTDGIAEGMKVFDFMRGDEPYKYREWDASDERNWLLRSSSTAPGGRARYLLFLLSEFSRKTAGRIRREYYDYRRYRLSGRVDEVPPPVYAMEKAEKLLRIGGHFIARHLPFRGVLSGNHHDRRHQ